MTETTCPSCDAPAPARARVCTSCGYRFFEDGGPALRRPQVPPLAVAAVAVAALAVVLAVLLEGGGPTTEEPASAAARPMHLVRLSNHPVGKRTAEALLEEHFLPVRDDDEADVTCSGRIPKPAHSVRRCVIKYPGGSERRIALLTNARGDEVLSEP
jgi:ribosomal protein L40E